jgi:signal transduction histidine kinase
MSLRSYLFSLVGSLIILLTLSQLFLVYWIEKNLAQEVEVKARHLSEQVIEMAFEKIDDNGLLKSSVKSSVKDEPPVKHKQRFEEHLEVFVTPIAEQENKEKKPTVRTIIIEDEQSKNAAGIKIHFEHQEEEARVNNKRIHEAVNKINGKVHINKVVLKKEFKTLINTIHDQQVKIYSNDENQNIVFKSPTIISHQWDEEHQIKSKTQQLIDYIKAILVICCVVALIFAYWLSIQFNKPLKLLTNGFKELARGQYHHRVPEQGVKEMRTTISHFNQMVSRLDQLTLAEQQHNEIAHLAELGEVSRGLAHSLRNPIHTIGLSIERLSENSLDKVERTALLKTVQNKITHIDKNIKALLTLTTTGITRDDNIPVLAVVQDIILEYKLCQEKPVTFNISIDSALHINGAESEIRSILHTLIINAAEACLTHGIVEISAHQDAKKALHILVADNGSGMNKTIAGSLFQPHVSTKPEGAGMGLYIAKRIISLHYQGDINLTNNITNIGCTAAATFFTK